MAPGTLAALLAYFSACALAADGTALPPSGLKDRGAPVPAPVQVSPDGRFRWNEGSSFLAVYGSGGSKPRRRVRLPPATGRTSRRKVLFAQRGDFFGVVDETVSELGLHLDVERGAKSARAAVIASWLRLVDSFGRVHWAKRLRDKHIVGAHEKSPLKIAKDGTLAVLLQDADPYHKSRPLLLVFSPRGRVLLEVDYVDFKHVDEFHLSRDGAFLAVKGYGRITARETWEKALAVYRVSNKKKWVRAVPRAEETPALKVIDAKGGVCCVREGADFVAYGPNKNRTVLDPVEAASRYGLEP